MAENKASLPAAVHVREYPPFALAMGMSFLSWLTGSIALDGFRGPEKDILIGVLFAALFLAALLTALVAWTGLLVRVTGLFLAMPAGTLASAYLGMRWGGHSADNALNAVKTLTTA